MVVGSAPYAEAYIAACRELADDRVRLLGGVWDQDLLDQLYANALTYLHGHSVGGTNPSLLRAIGAGAPTIAFDVSFNREVLGEQAYSGDEADVPRLVESGRGRPEGDRRSRGGGATRATGTTGTTWRLPTRRWHSGWQRARAAGAK